MCAQLVTGCSVAVLSQTQLTGWIKSQETVRKRPRHYPHLEENKQFFWFIVFKKTVWKVKMDHVMSSVVWRFKNKEQEGRTSFLAQPCCLSSPHLPTNVTESCTLWNQKLAVIKQQSCVVWKDAHPGLFQIRGNKKLFLAAGGLPHTHIKHGKRQRSTRNEFTQQFGMATVDAGEAGCFQVGWWLWVWPGFLVAVCSCPLFNCVRTLTL